MYARRIAPVSGLRRLDCAPLALLLCLAAPFSGRGQDDDAPSDAAAAVDPRIIEVQFTDGSRLKVTLADEKIELETMHGKLSIPAEEIRVIDVAPRYSPHEKQEVEEWIAALGNAEPSVRENAAASLLAHPSRTFAALHKAAGNSASPAADEAGKLIDQLREEYSPEELAPRETDMVQTEDAKMAGRILTPSLKVQTAQFGLLDLKLADARTLRSLALAESSEVEDAPNPKDALPDPGNLKAYEAQMGKVLLFKVTGGANGSLWGTGTYTTDSNLAAAAVHAGVLKAGETGIVQVKIVPSLPSFTGTTQNGLTSSGYGVYGGAYEVSKPKGKRRLR